MRYFKRLAPCLLSPGVSGAIDRIEQAVQLLKSDVDVEGASTGLPIGEHSLQGIFCFKKLLVVM